MADIMSAEARSRVMSRIRAAGTTPERYIDQLLCSGGFEFERHSKDLQGKPDFVFRPQSLAVFVDGDFWHGWRFPAWSHRLSESWREKIGRNRKRDASVRRRLRRSGWSVLRIWEHEVEADACGCIRKIAERLPVQGVDWRRVEECYAALPPLKRRNRLPKP